MKTTILSSLLTLLSLVSFADTNTPQSATLEAAVSASGWTVEELIAALNLVEAKYNRDVSTTAGRQSWHGNKKSSVLDVSNDVMVVTYEDGTVFRDSQKKNAQQRVAEANKRLSRPVLTKGIPKALAEARIRAAANRTNTVEVTQEITAGR